MRRAIAVAFYLLAAPFALACVLVAIPGMILEAVGDAVDSSPSSRSMFPRHFE